jgi:O-antigen/teichoic acid export membrane protein
MLPKKAAMGACVYSAILLSGIAAAYYLHSLSALSAFLVMAAGGVVAGPLLLRWFKDHVPASRGRHLQIKEVVRQHWNYGRWALASSVAIWFSAAIYYPLMGSFFSLADTGAFKALMNLASPIGQVFVAFTLLSLPYTSRAYHEQGPNAAGRLAWKLSGIYVIGTSFYWVVLLLVRGPVVHHLYGGRYNQIVALLPWLAVGSIVRIAATAQAIVLRAMRAPSLVFVAYCAACVVSIVFGVPATRWYGLRGAVMGWVLSSATALVGAILIVRYKSNSPNRPETAAAKALALREEAALGIR